jgi:hypothetical protein
MSSFVFGDKIVYFGGMEDVKFSKTVAVFDSKQLRWKILEINPPNFFGCSEMAAVKVGQFIVSIGGKNEKGTCSPFVYDTIKNSISYIQSNGLSIQSISQSTAIFDSNSRIFLYGGYIPNSHCECSDFKIIYLPKSICESASETFPELSQVRDTIFEFHESIPADKEIQISKNFQQENLPPRSERSIISNPKPDLHTQTNKSVPNQSDKTISLKKSYENEQQVHSLETITNLQLQLENLHKENIEIKEAHLILAETSQSFQNTITKLTQENEGINQRQP